MPKLKNPRHERFAHQYALTHNASEAYRQAFKAAGRMKPADIASSASRLLKDVKVASRVSELHEIVAKKAEEEFRMDADWMLDRLQGIDELDIIDILDNTGNVLPIRQWPKVWRTSISGLDIQELMSGDIQTIVRKLKLPDKQKNLEMIGKHVSVQAFKEQRELSGGLKMTHEEALEALE